LSLSELKNVADILQLETSELQGLKLQHDQKVVELEKAQVDVLEVRRKERL
jgi:centriolin